MSRRPANVTQADIARAVRAAKQTGAMIEVEIRFGQQSSIVIRLNSSNDSEMPLESTGEIVL
jgi:DNA-binding XRE family transcriptional regulator